MRRVASGTPKPTASQSATCTGSFWAPSPVRKSTTAIATRLTIVDGPMNGVRESGLQPDPEGNTANRGLQSNNRSGYIGVRATSHGTFSASINHLDKYISLGAFSDPISAAKARDQRAFEIWGKFATLNFPLGIIQPSVALPLAA